MEVRLQPLARHKVASLGDAGRDWLDALPATLSTLAERWELTLERPLPGGSASYVVAARTAAGQARVLKVAMPVPGEPDAGHAARVLDAAGGRGYCLLHAYDAPSGALLLERLGRSLEQTPGEPARTLDTLVDVLAEAWRLRLDVPHLPKAQQLRDLVVDLDERHGRPCDPRVRRLAEDHAHALAEPGPDAPVVLHGDPHPANALRSERTGGHVLVDPGSFAGDPAYDLGVVLREWSARVLDEGRPPLEAWCDRVAERSGVDRERIWRWAFLERVSTGLYVLDFGARDLGERLLRSAARLLDDR